MSEQVNESRRHVLVRLACACTIAPFAAMALRAAAAEAPLVSADDPTAKALKYTDDATKAPAAKPGSKCATCALYQGGAGAAQGPCLLFPGKAVKAAGWCSSWAPKPA